MSGAGARDGATRVAAAALLRAAARGEPGGVPHLVVQEAGAPHRRVALGRELTVGRGPVAALRLADGGVSRLHARFRVEADGAVTVEDLGSKNGVRRGGRPLGRGPCALAPGEAVVVGETTLVLADPLGPVGGVAEVSAGELAAVTAAEIGAVAVAVAPRPAPAPARLLGAAAGLLALAGLLIALGG